MSIVKEVLLFPLTLIKSLFGGSAVVLNKSEKRKLKEIEKEAYYVKAEELAKVRGKQRAKDKFDY